MQKRRHMGAGLVSNMFWFLLSFHLSAGFFFFFLHVVELHFFLWPEAHQAEGEMENRLPAWMQNCFGKPRQTLGSVIVPTDSMGQYMRRQFCQEAALALSMMAWMYIAL